MENETREAPASAKCIRCGRYVDAAPPQQLCTACGNELQAQLQASMRSRFANAILDNAARLAAAKAMQ